MATKFIYLWLGQLQVEYSAINLCKAYYNRDLDVSRTS